jgi:hypothetical protein
MFVEKGAYMGRRFDAAAGWFAAPPAIGSVER